ncbi:hypothetical protein ACN28S_05110 [Cystobacter fuscus]
MLLRWKLDAPTAYQLTLSTAPGAASAPTSPAASKKKTRASKKSRKRAASTASEESSAAPVAQNSTFFLLRGSTPTAGALPFALIPEAPGGETQQGRMSERGFVLEGLSGAMRNLAVMVLELPVDPVGPGSAWVLATDPVDMNDLPAGFRQKNTQHKSEVKLTSLTPWRTASRWRRSSTSCSRASPASRAGSRTSGASTPTRTRTRPCP